MPSAVMLDIHGDGAPKGILMVMKDETPVLCNKSNKRRRWTYARYDGLEDMADYSLRLFICT